MSAPSPARRWRDAALVAAVALALRLGVVAWAWSRVPPIADGYYYDVLARRIAAGLGYTWQWADGSVTYAAHYPVGYPAFVAAIYRVLGPTPGFAMIGNAVLGAIATFSTHRIVSRGGSRAQAIAAAALVAVHPDLVSYTPALMTEGVAASLVALAMWLALRLSEERTAGRFAATALALAAATYVRPQCALLSVLLPLALARGATTRERRVAASVGGAALLALTVAAVAPWTLRNCARMGRCAFVSVNDGWNLLIGTDPDARGGWAEVKVPPACARVEDEAEKNACFGEAGRDAILANPGAWLALAPKKLAATFDYGGAGPWYLRAANPDALSEGGKRLLGGATVLFERLAVAAGAIAAARVLDTHRRERGSAAAKVGLVLAVASAAAGFFPAFGWIAVLLLIAALAIVVSLGRPPPVFGLALAQLASTALVHVVFFGSGRYAMVTFPVVTALAVFALPRSAEPRERAAARAAPSAEL